MGCSIVPVVIPQFYQISDQTTDFVNNPTGKCRKNENIKLYLRYC